VKGERRLSRSPYMEWAKRHAAAPYDLAASGVASFPLAELPVTLDDLEITGTAGYGYAPLQERLAARCRVPAECVVAATGTSMANYLAMAALIEPGDEILIEEPTYELLVRTASYLGAEVRRFVRRPEDGFAIDPEAVDRAFGPRTRLVVVTNLHNPSSVRASDETLSQVAQVTRSRGARLLVDEVYLEACFDAEARSAFHLGPGIVTTASLTKAYGLSGLRCGWILAEPSLAERMWRLWDLHGASAAHSAERLSIVALDHLPGIRERAKTLLERNRARLTDALGSRDDLVMAWPESGTTVFPRLVHGRVDDFCRDLRERHQTSVVPGHFFGAPEHFRVGIGGPTPVVAEGLVRLVRALEDGVGA